MCRAATRFFVGVVMFVGSACSNANFGGKGGSAPPPPSSTKKTTKTETQKERRDNDAPPKDKEKVTSKIDSAPDTSDRQDQPELEPLAKEPIKEPEPLIGPKSNLTVTINDRDSKLDVFQVRNVQTSTWLPISWREGVQQIPGACSPNAKTTLSLQMHAKDGFFSKGGDLQPGTCNAPVTMSSANTVGIGINPGCGEQRAAFVLSCSGSASLEVVP